MDFEDFFVLIATVFDWVKKVLAALGLLSTEQGSKIANNIDNALDYIDTEPNTYTG